MNTNLAQERAFHPARRQAGLSLVELMVSITIGMFLLLGLTTLIVQQSSTREELEKSSRQIENGRYAMQLLHDDIQLAGFYGEYAPTAGAAVNSTPDPCDLGNQGWLTTPITLPVPVFGYPGADPNPACLADRLPGTAILVLRRTATEPVAAGAAVANTNYLQVSRCNTEPLPFVMASDVAAFTLQTKACGVTLADIRKYMVRIYYISSAAPDNIPTLTMREFVDNAQSTIRLVEGIEDMQFEYGLDNVAPIDGAPDVYVTAPALADWSNVVAVRVGLLARNIDTTKGYQDTKTYTLASGVAAIAAKNDNYKRHAYSEVTRVVNVSGRREKP
jgi:type IV pilus assembly protein PilW